MAPETPAWLNLDYAQRILRLAEDDITIQVIDVFMKPATSKGDNYTSDMMRVTVEFTRDRGDEKVNEKKSLIFKFEPMKDSLRKDMIEKSNLFDTEITMMTDTLKKMNDILGYESRLGGRVFHVRMERPLCLIMEDLAPLGFRMADRQAGLDLAHSILAIQGLAKFHASSVALCEKEPKHKALYKKGIFSNDHPEEIAGFFNSNCALLAKEIETWTELDKDYGKKLAAIASKVFERGANTITRRDDEFNVINHGDCWVNNMLFRYDEKSKPVQHIFVDFQLCMYTSPAIDLQYFLNTSPSEEVFDTHTDMLLEEYLKTLTNMMKKLGCKTLAPSMKELKKCMQDRAFYAFIASISILPIILTDKSQVKDLDEMMPDKDNLDVPGHRNPIYRKIMGKRLPKFDEMGLFDL